VVFPLPLTPFERYYLADDCPEYPTIFLVELEFIGRLDRAAFASALQQAIERHPLLGAVVGDERSKPAWVAGPPVAPYLDWADSPAAIAHSDGEYLDLRKYPGLRAWVRLSDHATRLLFQFHHACCDGLASIQFIDDVLVLYATATGGSEAALALPKANAARLADRNVLEGVPTRPSLGVTIRDIVVTGLVWSRILFRGCSVLAAPAVSAQSAAIDGNSSAAPGEHHAQGGPPREILEFESYHLTSKELESYQNVAASLGVTANDLLARDVLLALDDWNRAQGAASIAPCRLNIPVNVRGREGADIPASNRIGFAFVDARKRDFADRATLLQVVHRQTEQIKKWKLALYFLGGLGLATNVRGAVPAILRWKQSFATIVLSNVGRLFGHSKLPRREGQLVCGDVVLKHVTGVPPIRPNTRAAFIIAEYAGTTIISARCDPRFFDRAQTRALLETFIARIRETVDRKS
jgi:hypothetical protein